MSHGTWRRGTVIFAVLTAVTAASALLWPDDEKGGGSSSDSTTTSSASADEGNDDTPVPPGVIRALTVRTASMRCTDGKHGPVTKFGDAELVSFAIGALEPVREDGRVWSDSLSTPLTGETDVQRIRALETAICRDPLLGVTVANLFANLNVGRIKVVDLNDWLKPYQGHARRVNDRAARFIPLMDEEDPSDKDVAEAVAANLRYQRLAEKLNTLVSRFAVGGVKAERSTSNYHLVAGGLVAGGLPEVGLNPHQEALPALTLMLTEKGACAPLKIIGFNLFDKRPEEFAPPRCVEQPPTTTTNPPPSGCRRNCAPSPGCTQNCSTTSTTRPPTTTTTSCPSGKCVPPTTVSPPPTTAPPGSTTTPTTNGGHGDSGDGAINTTVPPTTVEPAPAPPTTSSPTTNPPKP